MLVNRWHGDLCDLWVKPTCKQDMVKLGEMPTKIPGNTSKPSDAHHEKIDLKVFVRVIPKEGWGRVVAPILFFGVTPTF